MEKIKEIIIGTNNDGKYREICDLLPKKIKKRLPIVLYGSEFWNSVINWDYLVDCGTVSEEDLDLFHISDSIEDTYNYIVRYIEEYKLKGPNF